VWAELGRQFAWAGPYGCGHRNKYLHNEPSEWAYADLEHKGRLRRAAEQRTGNRERENDDGGGVSDHGATENAMAKVETLRAIWGETAVTKSVRDGRVNSEETCWLGMEE
jgi:hypothetical protein